MIGQSRFPAQIYGDDILRQIIIKTGQNHLVKRAIFDIGAFRFCLRLLVSQSVSSLCLT
jgi:hypothetical protein